MRLKDSVIKKMRENMLLRIEFRMFMQCSENSMYRWLRENDPILTQYGVLKFLASKIGEKNIDNLIEESEILVDEMVTA